MFRLTTAGTPAWKLGLIPVLAGVLFKVTRPSSSDSDFSPEAVARHLEAYPQKEGAARKPTVLPELSLNDALSFDPFRTLALPVKPEPEETPAAVAESAATAPEPTLTPPAEPVIDLLQQRAATLKQLKVSAVFPSKKGAMAIIDSKTVRAGDWLTPGVRVVEIRGSDVILRVEDGEPGAKPDNAEAATR